MVHLSPIVGKPKTEEGSPQKEKAPAELAAADDVNTSVYGSRFADEDLPKHEMPEGQMPKDVAYRLIRDDLSLDGNPKLK